MKRKSKRTKQKEDDLEFYLEYWKNFPPHFKKIAQREINDLEKEIKDNN